MNIIVEMKNNSLPNSIVNLKFYLSAINLFRILNLKKVHSFESFLCLPPEALGVGGFIPSIASLDFNSSAYFWPVIKQRVIDDTLR